MSDIYVILQLKTGKYLFNDIRQIKSNTQFINYIN